MLTVTRAVGWRRRLVIIGYILYNILNYCTLKRRVKTVKFFERREYLVNLANIRPIADLLKPINLDEQRVLFLDYFPKQYYPQFVYDDRKIKKQIILRHEQIDLLTKCFDELEEKLEHPYGDIALKIITDAALALKAEAVLLSISLYSGSLDEKAQFYLDRIYEPSSETDVALANELWTSSHVAKTLRQGLIPEADAHKYSEKKLECLIDNFILKSDSLFTPGERKKLMETGIHDREKNRIFRKLFEVTVSAADIGAPELIIGRVKGTGYDPNYSFCKGTDFRSYTFNMRQDARDSAMDFIFSIEHELTHFKDHVAEDDFILSIIGKDRGIRTSLALPYLSLRTEMTRQYNNHTEGHAKLMDARVRPDYIAEMALSVLITAMAKSGKDFWETFEYAMEIGKSRHHDEWSKVKTFDAVARAFSGQRHTQRKSEYAFPSDPRDYFMGFVRFARRYCTRNSLPPKMMDRLFCLSGLTSSQFDLLESIAREQESVPIIDRFSEAPDSIEFLKNALL